MCIKVTPYLKEKGNSKPNSLAIIFYSRKAAIQFIYERKIKFYCGLARKKWKIYASVFCIENICVVRKNTLWWYNSYVVQCILIVRWKLRNIVKWKMCLKFDSKALWKFFRWNSFGTQLMWPYFIRNGSSTAETKKMMWFLIWNTGFIILLCIFCLKIPVVVTYIITQCW